MGNHETKPTWPQIRDALGANVDPLCSAWLTGRFVNLTKEVTQVSDVVLAFESFDAMDEFEYDGRYPETIAVDGITRELDLIIGDPESDYDDGESKLLYARSNDEFEYRHSIERVRRSHSEWLLLFESATFPLDRDHLYQRTIAIPVEPISLAVLLASFYGPHHRPKACSIPPTPSDVATHALSESRLLSKLSTLFFDSPKFDCLTMERE
ncbi:hypothetical protein [Haladaptatus sp. W1]|uniref:hypothetical protein n=1 Tax=Haladaptatus sp. W1 TaxID=1897478 RepID=UPI0020C7A391|nr:hypothetical protein [Haladaptatus sp. W1]